MAQPVAGAVRAATETKQVQDGGRSIRPLMNPVGRILDAFGWSESPLAFRGASDANARAFSCDLPVLVYLGVVAPAPPATACLLEFPAF
jgi:hypothetical protein